MSSHVLQSQSVQIICPVCNTSEASILRHAFDDRYGHPDVFSLVSCNNCGHIMTFPRIPEEKLASLYSNYYPRDKVDIQDLRRQTSDSQPPFSRLRRWWFGTDNQGQYFAQSGQVLLDIGCGSGLSLLEAKALGAEVRGIEADPNVIRIANSLDLKIHIGSIFDEPFPNEQFDLIVLNQVIEHAPEPDRILTALRGRLKHNASVVLVFPNLRSFWLKLFREKWINWHVPYHLHHFTPDRFVRMVSRLGFDVCSVRTITPNLWTILQFRACQIPDELGKPSPIWHVSPRGTYSSAKSRLSRRGSIQLLRTVIRRLLFWLIIFPIAILNRFIDILGMGDSVMVKIAPSKTL